MSGCRSEVGRLFRETPVAKSSVCSLDSKDVGVSGAQLGASRVRAAGSRRLGTMELDLAATCRREWPACSPPAASPEASAGYEELVRCIPCIITDASYLHLCVLAVCAIHKRRHCVACNVVFLDSCSILLEQRYLELLRF